MTARAAARCAGCLAAIVVLDSEARSWNPGSVAARFKAWDQRGDVFGDRAVESTPEADRTGPVEMKGELLDGTLSARPAARDDMFVLNVWVSWRAPCVGDDAGLHWVGRDCKQRTAGCSSCAPTSARSLLAEERS